MTSCPIAKRYGVSVEDHWRNGCTVHESHPPAWFVLLIWAVFLPFGIAANVGFYWGIVLLWRWLS